MKGLSFPWLAQRSTGVDAIHRRGCLNVRHLERVGVPSLGELATSPRDGLRPEHRPWPVGIVEEIRLEHERCPGHTRGVDGIAPGNHARGHPIDGTSGVVLHHPGWVETDLPCDGRQG